MLLLVFAIDDDEEEKESRDRNRSLISFALTSGGEGIRASGSVRSRTTLNVLPGATRSSMIPRRSSSGTALERANMAVVGTSTPIPVSRASTPLVFIDVDVDVQRTTRGKVSGR